MQDTWAYLFSLPDKPHLMNRPQRALSRGVAFEFRVVVADPQTPGERPGGGEDGKVGKDGHPGRSGHLGKDGKRGKEGVLLRFYTPEPG
jgi:hypothetical protein